MAYAKANPGKLNYGSAGVGSASHLGCVMLDQAMGTNAQHVPYRGTGPAMQDLIGGRIDFLCDIAVTAVPAIKGGTVKGLATLAGRRMAVLPDMPTAAESGLPSLRAYTWTALFAAEGHAGADRGKAERRDRRRHERAGVEGATGRTRRDSGDAGAADAGLSHRLREEPNGTSGARRSAPEGPFRSEPAHRGLRSWTCRARGPGGA